MRTDGNEQIIELSFDCAGSPGSTLKRTESRGMTYVRHEVVSGIVSKTSTGYINVPSGMNVLCINASGTLMARSAAQSRIVLVPPMSIAYIRGTRLMIQAARGEHKATLLVWQSNVTSLLDAWIQGKQGRGSSAHPRLVACKPIDPHFRQAVSRVEAAIAGSTDIREPLIVSVIYEVVSQLMYGADEIQLAATPPDIPDTIRDLIHEVRSNPAAPWPLKEAAGRAGYSPFHFSRVFKNMIGYGFHEYVDRCRTEAAVDLLVQTSHAVDVVASTAGFGTTQAMRESVKEYLGLVPSELRLTPGEQPDTSI